MFLSERSEPLEDGLARVSGAEVSMFVLRESRRRSACSTEMVVCALRALLRFLHARGVDRRAAGGGGAVGRPSAGGSPPRACGRAGEGAA